MINLDTVIKDFISRLPTPPLYENVLKEIEKTLEVLSETGKIELGPDENLRGTPLEIRTRLLFEKMGFDIRQGHRSNLEDFIISPPTDAENNHPLVLEVKSSNRPNISRGDLRQLDDWVFDLSGEEKARKEGLGGGLDTKAILSQGFFTTKRRHPTPYKGVMIFNGPIGINFSERNSICFDENNREFIEKRDFCIIPLSVLIDYVKAFGEDKTIRLILWECIHKTRGMLKSPE